MGYNKRHAFLVANKDMVEKLTRLADKQGWEFVSCKDPDEAQKVQFHINNLLSTLALWHPDKAYVRNTVRTNLDIQPDGSFRIYIGIPPAGAKLRGAKPRNIELSPIHAAPYGGQVGVFEVNDIITSENWPKIWLAVLGAADIETVRHITFKYPPDVAGIKWISEQLSPAFAIESTKPSFILRREAYIPVQLLHRSDI